MRAEQRQAAVEQSIRAASSSGRAEYQSSVKQLQSRVSEQSISGRAEYQSSVKQRQSRVLEQRQVLAVQHQSSIGSWRWQSSIGCRVRARAQRVRCVTTNWCGKQHLQDSISCCAQARAESGAQQHKGEMPQSTELEKTAIKNELDT